MACQFSMTDLLRDVVYACVDGKALLLDLYLPARTAGPLPVILWVLGTTARRTRQPAPASPLAPARPRAQVGWGRDVAPALRRRGDDCYGSSH